MGIFQRLLREYRRAATEDDRATYAAGLTGVLLARMHQTKAHNVQRYRRAFRLYTLYRKRMLGHKRAAQRERTQG